MLNMRKFKLKRAGAYPLLSLFLILGGCAANDKPIQMSESPTDNAESVETEPSQI